MVECNLGRQVCRHRFPTWVGLDLCDRRGELPWLLRGLTGEACSMADRAPEAPHAPARLFRSFLDGDSIECRSNRGCCAPVDSRPWYQDDLWCREMVQPRIWPDRKASEFDSQPDPLLEPDTCPLLPERPVCDYSFEAYSTCDNGQDWF